MVDDLTFEHKGQTFLVRLSRMENGWRADVLHEDGRQTGLSVLATQEIMADMFEDQGFEPLPRLQETARDAFVTRW
jgi:hypothetical protein